MNTYQIVVQLRKRVGFGYLLLLLLTAAGFRHLDESVNEFRLHICSAMALDVCLCVFFGARYGVYTQAGTIQRISFFLSPIFFTLRRYDFQYHYHCCYYYSVVCWFRLFYCCYCLLQFFLLLRTLTFAGVIRTRSTASIVFAWERWNFSVFYSISGVSLCVPPSVVCMHLAIVFELLSFYAWIFTVVLVAFVILLLLLMVYYSGILWAIHIHSFSQSVSHCHCQWRYDGWWLLLLLLLVTGTGTHQHSYHYWCSVVCLLAHRNCTTHSDHMMMMMEK